MKSPDQMDDLARQEWKRIAPLVADRLTEPGRIALESYCSSYSTWLQASERVREVGAVVAAPGQVPIQNPWLLVAGKAMENMQLALLELNLPSCWRGEKQGGLYGFEN